ncbi:MAG: tRNA lysidine(34) synthetase TilS [Desulfitobacteriaceae bacterium]|nr:tRNA lysidine(34) synthetase TilS [Desulfitobacteriaceae bacterium]MDD4346071.1 tRNA lysidine(34) synthetase TilS [Desulfitobacteriaceae bacterium]MDD4401339.1 tRNA lysidine(34) synthetase TilS [Desulfitobacteriaceae bacterium]
MYQRLCTQVFPELITDNVKVLVAVSGGPDSVALGHLLWRYAHEKKVRGLSVTFSHVHHGIRKESDEEAIMVQKMAAELGVPCIVHWFNAKEYAKLSGQSFQLAAREWRYARWKEDCQLEGCSLLATAHHLGDQAETILYRLLRGSGTAGLAGIHPSKSGIIRPLLGITKEEILDYCRQEGLMFALDSSNEEPLYDRNRIRLELIPELEKSYNPRIIEALGRTGKLLRWDEDFLETKVEEVWEKYCLQSNSEEVALHPAVFQEPSAILSRLLRRAALIVTAGARLSFGFVDKIMNSKGIVGWSQDIPGFRVEVHARGIIFKKSQGAVSESLKQEISFNVPLQLSQWVRISDLEIRVGLFLSGTDREQLFNQDNVACFAVGNQEERNRFVQSLVCRSRKNGDKMWFKGVGHKMLKKVFQDAHVSARERNTLPLIVAADEVLWIPGVKRSDRFLPEDQSLKLLCVVKKV